MRSWCSQCHRNIVGDLITSNRDNCRVADCTVGEHGDIGCAAAEINETDTQVLLEKDLGVCLVDLGGGTTDIAVFTDGAIRHTAVIPIAGDQVTNDIAMALRTPTPHAEEIKIKYACALASLAGENETIKVPSVGDRSDRDLSRQA